MAPNVENFHLSLLAAKVFTPGSAINEKSLFAGRIKQIRRIVDTVSQTGQHAVLYGEPGVGKTSLANVCSEFLSGIGTTVLAPRVNCVTTDTYSTLWKKVFAEVEITKKVRGIGFNALNSETVAPMASQMPETIRPDHVMVALKELSYGLLTIIIIDEFDRIDDRSVRREMADTIKMLSDHQIKATLLLVGVADSVTDLIAEHQSIERALIQIHMPRMEQEELEEIVHTGLEKLTMAINEPAEIEIISLAKGLPYFVHLLCLHACRKALDVNEKEISLLHLEAAIREALEGAQQTMRTAYHRATTSVRKDTIHKHVLLACSLAETDEFWYFAAASVVNPLTTIRQKQYEIPYFAQHLREFSDDKRGRILQILGEPHSRRYRFKNPMMQPFVIMKGLSDGLVSAQTLKQFRQISEHSSDGGSRRL